MSKNIILCLDGTGKEYGKNKTNVVRMFEAAARDESQITFYDPGVGTFCPLGIPALRPLGVIFGKAFGAGLCQNLADPYAYLMEYYEPGDRIFLFGFSRGAFTARALAGMLYKCGLLERGSHNQIPYVMKMYLQGANGKDVLEFKKAACRECKPYFIGVWDTVKSLGLLAGKKFFDQRLNKDLAYGYHAVSIDEKRRQFPVSLWDERRKEPHQVIEQVWFPGTHSDVGGSYPERELSDISLEWMLGKAQAAGLRLRGDYPKVLRLHPWPRGILHESRRGFWRLTPTLARRIPEGAKIHRSVFERPAYSPPLPVDFEVADTVGPEEPGAGTFDADSFRHLLARGLTPLESDPERVWQAVQSSLAAGRYGGARPSWLDSLPEGDVRRLVSQGVVVQVPQGAMITHQGREEREMFIALDGRFEATDQGQTLNQMGRGELFGEISFFRQDGLRIASVRALTEGRLLVLRRRVVDRWLRQNSHLAAAWMRQLGSVMAEHLHGPARTAGPIPALKPATTAVLPRRGGRASLIAAPVGSTELPIPASRRWRRAPRRHVPATSTSR